MKLPISLPFGKSEKQKYILALLLRDEKISALITEEVEGKMRIVGQHEELLKTPLETLSQEEWLDVLDTTISRAEETLPPDRETHDTVFGVKESWVEEKKIKKEYLLKLKKLSETLSLTPIGFLVVSEAITHLIEEEEGAPVSAILVDIGNRAVTATLVRGGKVLETKTVPKGESLPETVDTALKHLTSVEVFPSRLILFAGHTAAEEKEKPDHLAQQFISHHWSKSLPFLHAPQISVLAPGFDAKAVVQGAASQMGFSVLNLSAGEDEIRTYDQELSTAEKKAAEPEKKQGEKTAAEESESRNLPPADFGFVMDEDISKHTRTLEPETPEGQQSHHAERTEQTVHHPLQTEEETKHEAEESNGEKPAPLAVLTGLLSALPLDRIKQAFPPKKLDLTLLTAGSRNKFLLIPVILLLLLGGLYFFYTANAKAEVTVFLKPNNVSETADVLFSTDAGNNFADGTIDAKTVSVALDGSVSGAVTGKKKIGEKAQGTVTIYNNDDKRHQFSAGTTITTEKGLKFTLDKDISIASASGDIFSGTKPGTAQVSVTASEIGTDYNLPSGTTFNVSGASDIAAKNDAAFSGGTEKDVTVVSKKDQDKLLSDLSKSLQDKAKTELDTKATGEEKLLPFLTQAAVTKKTFDHKVDQEAKTLKLNGTVSYEALVFTEKDIQDFAEVALKNKYNDNLNLSDKGISYEIRNEKQKGEGEVAAEIAIQAGLVPKLDTASLIGQISGKSVSEAEEILNKLPQVEKTEVTFSPFIPFLSVFLPQSADKITLKTALNE